MAGWEFFFTEAMTNYGPTVHEGPAEPFGPVQSITPTGRPRRKRWPFVTLGIVILIAIAAIVCFSIDLPDFALVPGQAQAVGPLLSVPKDKAHAVHGSLLLTDVGVADVTLGNWLYFHFDHNAVLYPKSDFIESGTNEAEYDAQGTVEMDESQLTAAAVSLRQLGYSVTYHDAGVLVWATELNTPAYNDLKIGDVITAVDGIKTPNAAALETAMAGRKPGQTVTLTVGTVDEPNKGHDVKLTLSKTTSNGVTKAVIGVGVFTQPGWDFPFKVSVNLNNIGGPSAGLAFTLGLIDTLSGGKLTGGRTISATGTICASGSVGQVGGIPQKTIAVENAHASVFLVPKAELSQAESKNNGTLKIFGVTNLQQALNDLESLGGNLGSAKNGPVAGAGGHSLPTGEATFPSCSL